MAGETQDGTGSSGGAGRVTITVGEAAEMLGISRTSAYLCATRREIPTVRLGRRVLLPLARLIAMLEGDPPADELDEP